mmetsp:Transcript_26523/g.67415  ORF Transcript_26523/g.67415 Transcript_26523/m.67415 type:complete len:160 (+) Transcript_26523:279-758(+)
MASLRPPVSHMHVHALDPYPSHALPRPSKSTSLLQHPLLSVTSRCFLAVCLAFGSQASNLRFSSAPVLRGVRLVDAMHAWFFAPAGHDEMRYVMDDCGDLPCSRASGPSQQCPKLDSLRVCSSHRCKVHRRRRRIRIGLDPSALGRNVCDITATPPIAS